MSEESRRSFFKPAHNSFASTIHIAVASSQLENIFQDINAQNVAIFFLTFSISLFAVV